MTFRPPHDRVAVRQLEGQDRLIMREAEILAILAKAKAVRDEA